jgi:transposase InsO family protein
VPTQQATDSVIIHFLESNKISRFGCPRRIIIDNNVSFKSKKLVKFCIDYGITLNHSIAYYPQGNDLVESSNKSFIGIIKSYYRRIRNLGIRS